MLLQTSPITDWERSFINSVSKDVGVKLSKKQLACLDKICRKYFREKMDPHTRR